MKVLNFGYDTDLLEPENPHSEPQTRQARYCDLLNQRKAIVVMAMDQRGVVEQHLFGDRLWVVRAPGRRVWTRLWRAYRLGVRLVTEFQPDVVEYQDPQIAGLVAYLIARKYHLPLVGGLFNNAIDNPEWLRQRLSHRVYNAVGKFVLARSQLVRSNSRLAVAYLNARGLTQVEYIPFYVPWLEHFAASPETQQARLKRWHTDPIVLCVARLDEQKNIPLLLRAFAQTYHSIRRGRLVIVGTGALEAALKTLAAELGIGEQVEWAGARDYLDLPGEYFRANVFVLSSNFEGSARVLVLAQASGLPTLTTDTSGAHDVVKDGVTGYITPVRDQAALADSLRKLLTDENLYSRLLDLDNFSALAEYGDAMITGPLRALYDRARAASSPPA